MTNPNLSSPTSTGGSGTFFEQHVDAFLLAILLTRGVSPILIDCHVEEVHFQTAHLGWATDDLLVIGRRAANKRKLAIQVKRQFTVSRKDDDCKAVIRGFWRDFNSADRFDPSLDRLALVTLRGTHALVHSFNSLLDCSRASADGADFARRLALPGHLSTKAQAQASDIKAIIEATEGRAPSDDELWRLLRVLYVVTLDLNTPTAQNEAWIKTLLAHTASDVDAISAAELTWRQLLELVGSAMPSAASYKRDNLPVELRQRHAPGVAGADGTLRTLAEHSETTLLGISATIAHRATIDRNALVAQLLETLDENQVVVVTGPAGSGKSALAKSAIDQLKREHFCLAFRAEEFATAHFDQTLMNAQCSMNAQTLLAILAGQGRKVVLVESVERLLESPVRDAFSDLLRFAHSDRGLQFILTCRDYSLDTVQHSLLRHGGIANGCIEVPPLTDDELAQTVHQLPELAKAIDNPLRELLRSPYLLNMAAQMDWSERGPIPANERAFRERCWAEVVRRDSSAAQGMPRRRADVFVALAIRRAQALSPFVPTDGLDSEALEALRRDDLVALSRETSSLAAPAHDVLEDWAILQWLNAQFVRHEKRAAALAADVGGFPAIRRGYRKWLAELLELSPEDGGSFVVQAVREAELPAYFKDDTLVSTLLSSSAQQFLAGHNQTLLQNDGMLLVRVIHLLRVACKTEPRWLQGVVGLPSQILVPRGEAWAATLKIVNESLGRLLPAKLELLVGLIDDWARSVDWSQPEPPGAREAGAVAFALLDRLNGYGVKDLRKKVLEVVAKVPKADACKTRTLLERACVVDHRDDASSEFANIVLADISGSPLCRDFPEEVARLVLARYCLSEEDLRQGENYHASIDIGPYFGIRDHTGQDMFPASAVRGPFYPLLRFHPQTGANLILHLLNHAADWYGKQRWRYDRLEAAAQLNLEIPGAGQVSQWANPRLWYLYRGLRVGPYVLQTALMALESWLLEFSTRENVDVEKWLVWLLQHSNNVAITAVVASVCNAHPERSGAAALALLGSRELIQMDRSRMSQDHGFSSMTAMWTGFDVMNRVYQEERKKSDALPHRRHDLEALAVQLQLGSQRDDVWKIIDRFRAELPPVEEQTEEHRLWRLALHRMDVRGYRPIEVAPPPSDSPAEATTETAGRVYFGPGTLEKDVQEIVDSHEPLQAQINADLSILNWGRVAWERRESGGADLAAWKDNLSRAQERDREARESEEFARGGPGFVASVCTRDHWDEMTPADREWCLAQLISEINRTSDSQDESMRHARGLVSPDRPAAYVLSRVLSMGDPSAPDPRLVDTLARALTHSVSEVVQYAAEGVGYFLRGKYLTIALRCAGAIAMQARLVETLDEAERRKPYQERLDGMSLLLRTVPAVRVAIAEGAVDPVRELNQLDLKSWPGQLAAERVLQILDYCPEANEAKPFFVRIAQHLVRQWNLDRAARRSAGHRNFQFESECCRRLARFVLKLQATDALDVCSELVTAVNDHPRDVSQFVRALIVEEDGAQGATPFWEIWQAFADGMSAAPWVHHLESGFRSEEELLMLMFLGVQWKEGIRHWSHLEHHAFRIDKLVETLPSSSASLEAFTRYLDSVGGRSLPDSFVVVAGRLDTGNPRELLSRDNTVYHLESMLRRFVYGEPLRLKSNRPVREAVLKIVTELVESGSSAAYRMRDDFVTPVGTRT